MRTRNLYVLFFAQILGMCGPTIMAVLGGIIGSDLSPSPAWVTLPVTMGVVGLATFTIPAALIMKRIGRKKGYSLGVLIAGCGASLAIVAISTSNFILFCSAAFLVGANSAFIQQYRFAAAESVSADKTARAVSFLLVGGIAAGFLGPEIVKATKDFLPVAYTGPFLVLGLMYLLMIALLWFFKEPLPLVNEITDQERPLKLIIRQPVFIAAICLAVTAYGVMTFIMTATPVYMHTIEHYSLDATALVIQSHIIAMYAPSLFSGFLLERLGLFLTMVLGIICMTITVFLGYFSREYLHLWWALVLLGIGWNFLFIGGTVLLTRSYHASERFKSQATNDFSIFSTQAFASLSAGIILFKTNWDLLNLLVLPLLFFTFGLLVFLRVKKII